MAIKCVIFDLSDTLLDSLGSLNKPKVRLAELNFLRQNGVRIKTKDYFDAIKKTETDFSKIGFPKKNEFGIFAQLLVKNLGLNMPHSFAVRMERSYWSERDNSTALMPNAKKLLHWLNSQKILVIVLSNTEPKAATRRARLMGIEKYINRIFTSTELGHEKSSIIPFRLVLKWLGPKGISAGECLMVGNDLQEDMSAKHAGIGTVLLDVNVPEPKRKTIEPDYQIKNLIELKGIIRKSNAIKV